mmetsp:Transcript_147285/g.260364  ORF Transcript_147285/g.260364 Transcript_147285/m.260364 type:complete len:490 (-) Transcript_147285:76-1545(-)
MSCARTMIWLCLMSLTASVLAVDVPACGGEATCESEQPQMVEADAEYPDELGSEELGVQFVQKRTAAKRMHSSDDADVTEYEEIGDGSCLDITGSHGTENLRYKMSSDKSDPHTECQKACTKDEACTGYDNRPEGCLYYKIAIHDSNKASSLYKCYKKVKAHGKKVQDIIESKKDEGDLEEEKKAGCHLFTYNPAESLRSYSSTIKDEYGPGNSSMLHVKAAWRAKVDEPGQYMVMDMGKVTKIKGVLTQARSKRTFEHVKIFTCEVSKDGKSWEEVEGKFIGSARTSPVESQFPKAFDARYVKIVVQQWNAHVSMRAGAILCEQQDEMLKRIETKKMPKEEDCSWVRLNPPETARTYSSTFWDDAPGTGHAESMLDSAQAWTAAEDKVGEYMIMDLGAEVVVRGVLTQARMDRPWEYVRKYTVEYSTDGSTWEEEGELLTSSNSYERMKEGKFSELIKARYLKLVIKKWKKRISMRAGAMVCAPTSSK